MKRNIHNAKDYENKLLISKERKILKNIYNKWPDKIEELTKKLTIMILFLLLIVVIMKITFLE